VRDGDRIRLDSLAGTLEALVPEELWCARERLQAQPRAPTYGCGRELFSTFRSVVGDAESGASVCGTGVVPA
jgi:phosphogluconate dehydratase